LINNVEGFSQVVPFFPIQGVPGNCLVKIITKDLLLKKILKLKHEKKLK